MIELSKEELLILFEWAHRFCETEKLTFSHHAEAVVLDKIAGQLERELAEPFSPDYKNLLQTARQSILTQYEGKMGRESSISELPLEQD